MRINKTEKARREAISLAKKKEWAKRPKKFRSQYAQMMVTKKLERMTDAEKSKHGTMMIRKRYAKA